MKLTEKERDALLDLNTCDIVGKELLARGAMMRTCMRLKDRGLARFERHTVGGAAIYQITELGRQALAS